MEPNEWIYPYVSIRNNMLNIIIVGFTEASAFALCSLGQITVSSSRAAMILSMEGLSGAICGYLFLSEILTYYELFGCFLMIEDSGICP